MKKLLVLMVIVFVVFTAYLTAQPSDGPAFHKVIGKLKLSDEQKKDVDKIKVDMEKQHVAQKAKIETARIELQELFKSDSPDKSAIEKKLNEIAELEVQMKMIKIDSWFTVNKLLTPEQQKTWRRALESGSRMKQPGMKHGGKESMMQHHKGMRESVPEPPTPKE
jgi:Spy/CpxP family protein refolding chaperone